MIYFFQTKKIQFEKVTQLSNKIKSLLFQAVILKKNHFKICEKSFHLPDIRKYHYRYPPSAKIWKKIRGVSVLNFFY